MSDITVLHLQFGMAVDPVFGAIALYALAFLKAFRDCHEKRVTVFLACPLMGCILTGHRL